MPTSSLLLFRNTIIKRTAQVAPYNDMSPCRPQGQTGHQSDRQPQQTRKRRMKTIRHIAIFSDDYKRE